MKSKKKATFNQHLKNNQQNCYDFQKNRQHFLPALQPKLLKVITVDVISLIISNLNVQCETEIIFKTIVVRKFLLQWNQFNVIT
jgi:hypothetical protein